MLGEQDSPSSRITPRLSAVDEGDMVMSSTVTDCEGSFSPGCRGVQFY